MQTFYRLSHQITAVIPPQYLFRRSSFFFRFSVFFPLALLAFEGQRLGHGVNGELELPLAGRGQVLRPRPPRAAPIRRGAGGPQVEDGLARVPAQHEEEGVRGQGAWKGKRDHAVA